MSISPPASAFSAQDAGPGRVRYSTSPKPSAWKSCSATYWGAVQRARILPSRRRVVSGGDSASTDLTADPRSAPAPTLATPFRKCRRGIIMSDSFSRQVGSALEVTLGHRVDVGDAGAGDGVDPRLHLGERPKRLGQELGGVL